MHFEIELSTRVTLIGDNWRSLNKLMAYQVCPCERKVPQVFNFLGNLVASVVTSLER